MVRAAPIAAATGRYHRPDRLAPGEAPSVVPKSLQRLTPHLGLQCRRAQQFTARTVPGARTVYGGIASATEVTAATAAKVSAATKIATEATVAKVSAVTISATEATAAKYNAKVSAATKERL